MNPDTGLPTFLSKDAYASKDENEDQKSANKDPEEPKKHPKNALTKLIRTKQIKCKHCGGTFKNIKSLNTHMNIKHNLEKKINLDSFIDVNQDLQDFITYTPERVRIRLNFILFYI